MIALIASFFSLCVGPLVYQTFGPLKRTDKIVSGIVLVIVTGIIALEVLPHTYESIGYWAILLALSGFAGPTLIERTFHKAADTTHKWTIYLGISGLLLHALIDGAAIQAAEEEANNGLTLAIILHRLPVGLTIWWMLKPLLGERYALITLLMMGLSTLTGFVLNLAITDYHDHNLVTVIQAFIAGSLLHVVIHKPHSDGCMHTNEEHHQHSHAHQEEKTGLKAMIIRWESLGIIIGLTLLGFIQFQHN